ncbi:MAG: Ig-like domain-containing protein, partial [Nitrososphaerales archaeon]
IVDGPEHGTLVELDAMNGTASYVPSTDFFGRDSFTFKVNDGNIDSKPATVRINVRGINDAPIAIGGELLAREGQSLSFKLTATDADNDTLTYLISSYPAHGSLTGVAPNLSYVSNNRFDGLDALSFKVSDGAVDSNVATIVIKVKSADRDDHRNDSDRWWERTPSDIQETDGISSPVVDESAPLLDTADAQPDLYEPQQDQLLSVLATDLADRTTDVVESTAAALVLKDVLAPQFIFPASPLEAVASSYAGTAVTYTVRATDDTDGEVTSTCSPSSGSRFPVGKFNVVCTATDAAGNSALSSFIVIVRQASSGDDALAAFLLPTALAAMLGVGTYFGIRIVKRANSK